MLVIVVVLLLFGRGKISDLMGDVAQGIKAFRKGMSEDDKVADKPEPKVEREPSPPPGRPTTSAATAWAWAWPPRGSTPAHRRS